MAYKHIIVPIDLSSRSQQTLRYAFAEAEAHHAKLTLLHALHGQPETEAHYIKGDPEELSGMQDVVIGVPTGFDPETGARLPTPPAPQPEIHRRDHLEETQRLLCDLIPASFQEVWDVEIVAGDPTDAIVRIAQEEKADLIVMGSHGHTGLRHLLLGSVAEKVLRHAPCPVLIVRHDGEEG